MKVLLIGPYPPPHGGISVHVAGIHQQLTASGVPCRVLDTGAVRPGLRFFLSIMRHSFQGWTPHLHTNGHNVRSWILAMGCGLAAQCGPGSVLTLHSGMLPGYLEIAPAWRRRLAADACSLFSQVICVNSDIRSSLLSLGLDSRHMEVLPAYLGSSPQLVDHPPMSRGVAASKTLRRHWHYTRPTSVPMSGDAAGRSACATSCYRPLFSTVLFFRREYGFDLLVDALAKLKQLFPSLGCLVMGSGDQRPAAELRVREAGLQEDVLFLGDVDHDTCLSWISNSDVFLRPTLEDGDSISVREAISLGVPVVASRVGTRPPGAILFQPGDVEDMIAKVELALSTRREERRPETGCADRLLEIYRQVDGSEVAYA